MNCIKEYITPEKAARYLANNYENNRRLRPGIVAKYAADMKGGRWEQDNPQNCIVFDKNGKLKDGQHRLSAIIKAGVAVRMYVWKGVPEKCYQYDTGAGRSTPDILQFSGMSSAYANNNTVAVVRVMGEIVYRPKQRFSIDQIREYLNAHGEEIALAHSIARLRRDGYKIMSNSAIIAAFYCAMRYGIPADELRKFAAVVATGLQDNPWDTPAVLLRNFIINASNTPQKVNANYSYKTELYNITSKAIIDYHNHTKRTRSYKNTECTVLSDFVNEADKTEIERLINGR